VRRREKEGLPIAMMGGLFLTNFARSPSSSNMKMIVDQWRAHTGTARTPRAFIHLDELCALEKLPNVR